MKKIYFIIILALFIGCNKKPQLNELHTPKAEIVEINQTFVPEDNVVGDVKYEDGDIIDTTITVKEFENRLKKLTVYFDFDKYNIKESEWPKVEELAKLIKEFKGSFIIRIEGNCDEWGTEEYNYALGLKRAKVVKDALVKLGVNAKKLTVISYGELNPVCMAHNKECWAKNRRDDFTYLP